MIATNLDIVARRGNAFPTELPRDLSEAAFLSTIIGAAKWHRWMVHHQRPTTVRKGKTITAITGHRGFPDIVLARSGALILAELKTNTGSYGKGQPEWATEIGPALHRLWRPRDWPEVYAELAA